MIGRRPELPKNVALHFVTHPSLLFTDTLEPSVSLTAGLGSIHFRITNILNKMCGIGIKILKKPELEMLALGLL